MTKKLSHPTKEQSALIGAWRIIAQQKMPYMAPLLYSMTPVVVTDGSVDTVAIDPKLRLYINFDGMAEKSPDFGAEALLHECGHIFGEHHEMAISFHVPMTAQARKMWNYAGDCAINDDLRDAGCSELADHGVFANSIGMDDYQTPYAYYLRLEELTKPKDGDKQAGGDSEPESGDGAPGQGQSGPGQPGEDGQPGGKGQPGEGEPTYSGCGSGAGAEKGDFEIVPGSAEDEEFGGMAPAEIDSVIIQTAQEIVSHAKGQGFVPAGLAIQADMALAPTKTPWQRLFRLAITRTTGKQRGNTDIDMRRRDRRSFRATLRTGAGATVGNVITYGRANKEPTAVLFRDTSGSMSEHDLQTVSSEFYSMTRRLNPERGAVMVHDVDAHVYKGEILTREKCDTVLNTVSGRGGTDMRLCFTHVEDEYTAKGKRPSVVVVATDGGTGWPDEQPPYPVIVVLTKSGEGLAAGIPDWATVILLEE